MKKQLCRNEITKVSYITVRQAYPLCDQNLHVLTIDMYKCNLTVILRQSFKSLVCYTIAQSTWNIFANDNGQSRDTDNIWHTTHRTNKTEKHTTTQIPPKTGGESRCSRMVSSSAYYKTPAVIVTCSTWVRIFWISILNSLLTTRGRYHWY